MAKKRFVVIINKGWEAEPVINAVLHEKAAPREFGLVAQSEADKGMPPPIHILRHPFFQRGKGPNPAPSPRVVLHLGGGLRVADVEFWCVQDLMSEMVSSSSTLEKARRLPSVTSWGDGAKPDIVLAVGTAGLPGESDLNGSVVIGHRIFVHDPYSLDADRQGKWTPPISDAAIESVGLHKDLFREIDSDARFPAEGRFLRPPLGPDAVPRIMAGAGFVGLSTVNVVNYDHYVWADSETLNVFRAVTRDRLRVGSMETTHGVIRQIVDGPFLYISGIANPTGRFDFEVAPREYAQNFVAAHNAGIAVAWLLPQLLELA